MHLIKKSGFTKKTALTGAVMLIQRFGSALNLNSHDHMLFLDGTYVEDANGPSRFCWVKAPTCQELTQLAHTMAQRIGRFLERQGVLERDVENSYLASDAVYEDPMTQLQGHSITYRIAVGPQAGRKVFTLQTLSAREPEDPFADMPGLVGGFSHLRVWRPKPTNGISWSGCRYISRPAISKQRLSLTSGDNVRYQRETPYRNGTTHIIFEPLDCIARLAALVPKPRVNLTWFHGVFAPNSKHRALVTLTGFPEYPATTYSGPSLFLRGANSRYIPNSATSTIKQLSPSAKLHTIANAGHWLHAEQSTAVVEALLEFVAAHTN